MFQYAWMALSSGPASRMKNCKTPFFHDIQNSFQWATGIGLEPNQNFFQKKFQQTWSLEASKILAKMGRGWQAD